MYSINNKFYLLDLPGYGFAKVPEKIRESLQKLNWWYLFDSPHTQHTAVLVLDANVGPSKNDVEMLALLREHQKNIVIVANKIDKIKKATTTRGCRRLSIWHMARRSSPIPQRRERAWRN